MPKIDISLSSKSLSQAIDKLKEYSRKIEDNTDKLREKVAQELTAMVEEGFNGADYDFQLPDDKFTLMAGEPSVPDVSVENVNEGNMSIVRAHGPEAVFVEFGAGVYFNPGGAPHPARDQVAAIGEYGYGLGKMTIWRFKGTDGKTHYTHGTPASKPMWYSVLEIEKQIPDIAKSVFQNGG